MTRLLVMAAPFTITLPDGRLNSADLLALGFAAFIAARTPRSAS